MSAVVVQVRERARGNVTTPMVLWSCVVAVVLFLVEAHHGSHSGALWVGFGATGLFGAYLGLRRRTPAVFIAPFVSWMVAWFPFVVAAMIRDGFLKGIVVGFFWITIGWFLIGMIEFATLFIVASLFRVLRGSARAPDRGVAVFGPHGDQR